MYKSWFYWWDFSIYGYIPLPACCIRIYNNSTTTYACIGHRFLMAHMAQIFNPKNSCFILSILVGILIRYLHYFIIMAYATSRTVRLICDIRLCTKLKSVLQVLIFYPLNYMAFGSLSMVNVEWSKAVQKLLGL